MNIRFKRKIMQEKDSDISVIKYMSLVEYLRRVSIKT